MVQSDNESDWKEIEACLSQECSHYLIQRLGGRTFNHLGDIQLQKHMRNHVVDVRDTIRERDVILGILRGRDRDFQLVDQSDDNCCTII